MAEEKKKICFVISPIGKEGSDVRVRADKVLNHIIKPVTRESGYKTIRADDISEPGIITSQVIEHILNDDLVIADLTSQNPNVFYELAVRHAIRKPVVQIVDQSEPIPFDVSQLRTIRFDIRDIESVDNCKEDIKKQIETLEKDPGKIDSPITVSIDLQALSQSGKTQDEINASIIAMLQAIRAEVSNLYELQRSISTLPYVKPSTSTLTGGVVTTPAAGTVWATPQGTVWATPPSVQLDPEFVQKYILSDHSESKETPTKKRKESKGRKQKKKEE